MRTAPPLVDAHSRHSERLEFLDELTMARCVEQLVVTRKHEERPDRDAVERKRDVGAPDAIEQQIHHGGQANAAQRRKLVLSAIFDFFCL
jgi:hypothetical protein